MKKIISVGFIGLCLLTGLAACTKQEADNGGEQPLSIVTSFYPLWFMTLEIAGEAADVVNLAGNTSVHEYEPTPQDVVKLNEADLVIIQGAGLEPWGEDMASQLEAKGIAVLEVGERLNLLPNSEEHEEEGEDHSHGEYDPHTWLDPILAQAMVDEIATALSAARPDLSEALGARAEALNARFVALDEAYDAGLSECALSEVITSHDAFGYLSHRYGFSAQHIAGLSTEDEPSAQTLAKIAQVARDAGIGYILTEQAAVTRYAETLAKESDLELLPVNPLGQGPLDDAKDFFDVMEDNLAALRTAMACE